MDAGPEFVAERCSRCSVRPFELEGTPFGPLTLTASIGIAAGARPSATELLRDADIALYEAKTAGKDSFMVFRPEMHTVVRIASSSRWTCAKRWPPSSTSWCTSRSSTWPAETRPGLRHLLRWRHPDQGVVQPDDFIPILEDSGMIIDVGRWVLQRPAARGHAGTPVGYRLDVSVNVSARQLENDQLIDDVRHALRDSGFDPRSLIVEITETAIMRNMSTVVPRLAVLKATGVRIAIDDFGTGYSSLAYLQQFPSIPSRSTVRSSRPWRTRPRPVR